MAETGPRVAGVIVTYKRKELLRKAIQALAGQSRPLAELIVVDNASGDGTGGMVASEFPSVTYVALPENLGPGAAFAHGMTLAVEHGHEWVWMMNDDSFPRPSALDELVRGAPLEDGVGIVCCKNVGDATLDMGVRWRRGRPIYVSRLAEPPTAGRCVEIDVVTFAGALVSADVIRRAGVPRSDYFLMWEDYEYCLRVRRSGFKVLVNPNALIDHIHAGSGSPSEWSPPWRGYYQTRNHLHFLLHEERSLAGFWFWATRTTKSLAAIVLYGDRKIDRLGLRIRGVIDALRGRMGKTVDPAIEWRPVVSGERDQR